eukprot:gene6012-2843_t
MEWVGCCRAAQDATRGAGWWGEPLACPATSSLRGLCFQQRNQQAYSAECDEGLRRLEAGGWSAQPGATEEQLRTVVVAKIGPGGAGGAPRTPERILMATDVSVLALVSPAAAELARLSRLREVAPHQPYWHVNNAMRSLQNGAHPSVTVRGGAAGGRWRCLQRPPLTQRLDELRYAREGRGGGGGGGAEGLRWADGAWSLYPPHGPPAEVPAGAEVTPGTLLLVQFNALIWLTEKAVAEVRPAGHVVTYRGIALLLNPAVYYKGATVVWAQFTSTSRDQGVGASFAGGGEASVFIGDGCSGRDLAPWSRLSREAEVLYPSNVVFLVTDLLSRAQREILGKEATQVYEIEEVDKWRVADLELRRLMSRMPVDGAAAVDSAGQLQQVWRVISLLADAPSVEEGQEVDRVMGAQLQRAFAQRFQGFRVMLKPGCEGLLNRSGRPN